VPRLSGAHCSIAGTGLGRGLEYRRWSRDECGDAGTDGLSCHKAGLLGGAERRHGLAQCIAGTLQPGVSDLVARRLQLDVAKHVVAAPGQAQLQRQLRMVTIERQL